MDPATRICSGAPPIMSIKFCAAPSRAISPSNSRPGDRMKRREFIALLGGAAAAWPPAVRAQQSAKLPAIGFLGAGSPATWSHWTAAFVQRLRELGWIEGRTVAIQYRWADGRSERFPEVAAELVRLKVDVIVTGIDRSNHGCKAGDVGNSDRLRDG